MPADRNTEGPAAGRLPVFAFRDWAIQVPVPASPGTYFLISPDFRRDQ